jgi:hypothetical protein
MPYAPYKFVANRCHLPLCGLSAGVHHETVRQRVAKDVSNEHAHSIIKVLRQQCILMDLLKNSLGHDPLRY